MRLTPTEVNSFYSPFIEDLFFAGFKRYNHGSFREAYRRKKLIIKVPLNVDGVVDNQMEAKAFKLYGNKPTSLGIYLAPCRLLANQCLLMPFIPHLSRHRKIPEWAEMVEGNQIGSFKGRIVAYDYALDLQERYGWEKESLLKSDSFQNHWKDVKPFLYPAEAFPPDEEIIPPTLPIGKLVYATRP